MKKIKWKPSLTYKGGSGNSGTQTSKAREEYRDSTGKTAQTQFEIVQHLLKAKDDGLTIAEIRELIPGQHHGTLSGALTNLNNDGRVVMLHAKRGRCHIYVLADYQGERELAKRRQPKPCPNCGHVA